MNPLQVATLHGTRMIESTRLCEPMMMDEFVVFVNAFGPQTPKRVSKLDIEFSKQLTKK